MTPTPDIRRSLLAALAGLALLCCTTLDAHAQVCMETEHDEVTPWLFYATGAAANVWTFAGSHALDGTPMDGTFLVDSNDELVKIIWTTHGPLSDPNGRVSHYRCDLSVDTLEGSGEEIRIVVGQGAAIRVPLECRVFLGCTQFGHIEDVRGALGLE